MKKLYSALILVFMIVAVVLTGCSGATLSYPNTAEVVIGNGGIAAIKGDYLYYVNGYVDASLFADIRHDNVFGKEVRGAIYKTKLVGNTSQTIQKDEDGFLVETQVVVPQVVGFSNGGFYIIGDYLYYLTPLMEEDGKTTELKTGFLEVCRIKLDGTGKERVYKTNNAITNVNWAVYHMNDKPVVVMLDGTNLVSITMNGKKKDTKTMATNVTGVTLLQQSNYQHGKDDLKQHEQYVYYTRDVVGDDNMSPDTINLISKVKIGTNDKELIKQEVGIEYQLASFKNDKLYYSKKHYYANNPTQPEMYMHDILSNKEELIALSGFSKDISNFAVLDEEYNRDGLKVVTVDENNVMRFVQAGGTSFNIIYRGEANFDIITIKNNLVYIQQNGQVYRLNINGDATQEAVQITNSEVEYYASNASLIDIDGSRMFIFASYQGENETNNYYLNIIENISKHNVQEGDMVSKFVGKFKDGECPPKPEEPEIDEDDDQSEQPEKQPWII